MADVLVATPYGWSGSSARVRALEWCKRLAIDHVESSFLGLSSAGASTVLRRPLQAVRADRAVRATLRQRFDRVLIQRSATPFSTGSVEEGAFHKAGWGVYDFDDALYLDDGGTNIIRRVRPGRSVTARSVAACDRVIAGNEVLATWASDLASDVVVIPSCIEPDQYDVKTSYAVGDPPVVGWIGSITTERNLSVCVSALVELHQRTGARLELLSSARPGNVPRELRRIVRRIPWTEDRARVIPAGWDVGIMPLLDGPFERGKCGYKLLQYAASGVPMVGSPVGVNVEILTKMGMPAPSSATDWLDALLDLVSASSERREEIGHRAHAVAVHDYSYAAWQPVWTKALELDRLTSEVR